MFPALGFREGLQPASPCPRRALGPCRRGRRRALGCTVQLAGRLEVDRSRGPAFLGTLLNSLKPPEIHL